jgi:hypothetical protein
MDVRWRARRGWLNARDRAGVVLTPLGTKGEQHDRDENDEQGDDD